MSRSKEAMVVLLDAGASMCAPLRDQRKASAHESDKRRFDAAIAAVDNVLQQKLCYRPKDEIGIVVYGTDETDNQLNEEQGDGEYTNVSVLSSIDIADLQMCEKLRTLQPSCKPDTKVDILDGLIVALDLLFRRTDNKKYEKRLLVITDAATKIQDASDVESVVQMIQNMDVKLQIIGIDFTATTDEKSLAKDDVPEAHAGSVKDESMPVAGDIVKLENEKMLVSIAKEVGGEVSSVSKRMQLMAQGMKKTVALTTKFRGPLEIGQNFGIPVYCYLKTKVATLPTLSKESQASYDKKSSGGVKLDRRYTSPENPDEDVAPDQQVKAYRYGQEKVPFSSADVEFFKLQTEKSIKVLGFFDQERLSHAKFMSATDVFVPEPGKPHAAQALAALVDAMIELKQVAIARFVARKNAAPKIVALVPHAPSGGTNYYCFWSQVLPFEEDMRIYEFAPLKRKQCTPSAEQQELADRLVDSLSIRDDKAEEIGVCFNPVLRGFFHAVQKRAFDETAIVPPLPSYVESHLSMDPQRQKRIQDVIHRFGDAFQLKEAVKKQGERKKKSFWSDVPSAASGDDVKKEEKNDEDHSADGDDGDDSDLDLEELLDGGDVTSVGSMNPIADFENLVDRSKSNRQRLTTAVDGMQTQIEHFFQSGASFYPKAAQCLRHFRKRSAEIQYSTSFNAFLTRLKATLEERYSSAWDAIKQEGISLLSTEDDPDVNTTPAQARALLYGDEIKTAEASQASAADDAVAEEEDDMFAEFE